MNAHGWERPARQALVIIAVILVIGSLHLARSAIVPVLFAIFLALLLSPAVAALARRRVPRVLGAALVIAALVLAVGLALNATWRPARGWLDAAPATMRTLEQKLRPVTRVIAKVESVSEQAGRVTDPAAADTRAARPAPPAPDKKEMPVAWTRSYTSASGKSGRVFTTTHGASEDLLNEGFRRMAVNACLWAAGLEAGIRPTGDISFVGPFTPTTYSFGGFVKGLKPSDMAGWDTPIPKK